MATDKRTNDSRGERPYTDAEIEEIARFWVDVDGTPWERLNAEARAALCRNMRRALESDGAEVMSRAAAALMRRAEARGREHGGAEMRERAAVAVSDLPRGTWGNQDGETSPWPDAVVAIRALPLTPVDAAPEVKP